MHDVAFIGAGLQSITIAATLLDKEPDLDIVFIDTRLGAANWHLTTQRMGMTRVRTSWKHAVGADEQGLIKFAKHKGASAYDPNKRPYLSVFTRHAFEVVHEIGVEDKRLHAAAESISLSSDSVTIQTRLVEAVHNFDLDDTVKARHCVVAPGLGPANIPNIPGTELKHVYHSSELELSPDDGWQGGNSLKCLIVGGGLTAFTMAEVLLNHNWDVTICARDKVRVRPEYHDTHEFAYEVFNKFYGQPLARRAKLLRFAAKTGALGGSVTERMHDKVMSNGRGTLNIIESSPVHSIRRVGERIYSVDAHNLDPNSEFDVVIFATGYDSHPTQFPFLFNSLLDPTVDIVDGKYLAVGENLTLETRDWPRLYFTGALAKLAMGPQSSNVFGAQRAAEIITRQILT